MQLKIGWCAALLCLALGGGSTVLAQDPDAKAQVGAPAAPAADAAPSTTAAGYHLGPGDKIRVIVFGEDALSGEFTISGAGRVALPLIGEVNAQGLTPTDLQKQITAQLSKGYLIDPRVGVEVLNYRPFYILGEVNKPGEYPFVNGLTVLNAVAQAQGFTYRANTGAVSIRHAGSSQADKIRIKPDTPVQPGDTVVVKERWF